MKPRIILFTLALTFLLSSCAKPLDPDIQALAEVCDAVCMGRVESWERVPYPEETDLNLRCVEQADGSRWAVLIKLHLTADFCGNLTPRGTRYIFVLADGDWYSRAMPPHGKPERILFPDIVPGLTHRDSYMGEEDDCLVFAPHDAESVRWRTDDAEGLRFIESLRSYGRANRREPIPHAAQ